MPSGNTEIVANIKRITNELNGLKYAAKDASASAKLIGQAFEAGVSGKTAADTFQAYQVAIDKTNTAITAYNKKIAELETLQKGLDKDSKTYAADFTTLSGKIVTQKNAVAKLNEELIQLTLAQKKYDDTTIAAAKAEEESARAKELSAQKIQKLQKQQQTFNKVLKAGTAIITALVAAYKKMISSAIEQGTELYSLSKRYGATVEEIQNMNRALKIATGESDLFTNSLSVLAKGMSDIAGNRGQKYTAALRAIGLSYSELSNQTKSQQFESIVNGLMAIENESTRAAHAQTLLGESGQYIVGALADSKYSLQDYLDQAEKYSVITQQNAEDLTYLGFHLDAIKSQINAQIAQLVVDAEPTIINVMNLLKGGVSILNTLTKNSWLLWVAISALIGLKFVSSIMSWRVAMLQAAAAGITTAKSLFWVKIAAGGIAAVAATVAAGFLLMSNTAKQMKEDVDNAGDALNNINSQSGDFNTNVETYAAQNTTSTIILEATIKGEGNTAISDSSAQTVAQLTADELQKRWGDMVK